LTVSLDRPDDEEQIYRARGTDLSPARPLLTGDVLEDIELPGQEERTAMIVAHPCSMRRGVALAAKLTCAPVTNYQRIPPESWNGHFNVFPLASFTPNDEHRAARLDRLVSLDSADCGTEHRIACLEHSGIYLLQQRLIHCLARCKVKLSTIRASMEHVLEEAELQEEWVEMLAELDDPQSIAEQAEAFDAFLGGEDLRTLLRDANRRSGVVTRVTREIRTRAAA
jgi:hypothetical protein